MNPARSVKKQGFLWVYILMQSFIPAVENGTLRTAGQTIYKTDHLFNLKGKENNEETRVEMLKDNQIPRDRIIPMKEADFRDF